MPFVNISAFNIFKTIHDNRIHKLMKLLPALIFSSVIFSLSSYTLATANDPIADAKKLCHHQAVEKSGYNPEKTKSGNTTAKGAGAGAAGGTAVRAIQGKSLLKGAAIGAAAGAAAGGIKKNKDKKAAVIGESTYKTEYESCLRSRGLNPENVK
ncbi:MAG: hypothetical protein U9N50_12000 [Pseudomonadota bacterium]|nr:hypothetical protein [Pseudomonadota bacterium]